MTAGFLREMVTATRAAIAAPSYFEHLPATPRRGRPGFRESIERDAARGALVVEYKRVSPGYEDARLPRRTVEAFVSETEPAGVTAYSCLAARPRFDGAPADVAELVAATDRPVLFKEFVIDPVQVDAARRAGASAILLIARLATEGLLDRPLGELAAAAHRAGLEVVLEFHRSSELSEVADVAADVYGVNTRDLDTLRFERARSERTLVEASARGLRPLLGMSGVEGPDDARRVWAQKADGLLVGTAVARSENPAAFLTSLRAARDQVRA